MKKLLFAVAAAVVIAAISPIFLTAQCMTLPVSLDKRVAGAERICLGRVVSKEPYEGPKGNIFTLNRVQVAAWLKGHSPETEVGLITWGGFLTAEGRGQVTEPSLQLEGYNEYILFLDREEVQLDHKKLRTVAPAFRQSFAFAETQGAITGQFGKYYDTHFPPGMTEAEAFQKIAELTGETALRPNGKPFAPRPFVEEPVAETLTSFTPSTSHGGTIVSSDNVTITGTGFGSGPHIGSTGTAGVYFKNVDDGGLTEVRHTDPQTDYLSWSPTSITVKVPQKAGTGTIKVISMDGVSHVSGSTLTIPYSHSAVYSTFYLWPDTNRQRYYFRNLVGGPPQTVGYLFRYNSDSPTTGDAMSTNAPAKAAFERALTSWRCGTGWNAVVSGSSTTTADLADDGINSVMFVTVISGSASTVGRATSRYLASGTGSCDLDDTVWWLKEVDIEFELSPNGGTWIYSGTSTPNFESVAAHELGHGHGLQHVMASPSLMYFSSSGVLYPSADEEAGADARVAYSIPPTCFDPTGSGIEMTEVPTVDCSSAVLPIELLRFWCETRKNLVRLEWETASESNNDRFEVERGPDGTHFEKIGELPGMGNCGRLAGYFFDDENPAIGLNYYRLRQVDYDGKSTLSGIVAAFVSEKNNGLTVSPNPARDGETFIMGGGRTTFRLFTTLGNLARQFAHDGGRTRLDLGDLPPATYFLIDENGRERRRLSIGPPN